VVVQSLERLPHYARALVDVICSAAPERQG